MHDLTLCLIQSDLYWENKAKNLTLFEQKIQNRAEIVILLFCLKCSQQVLAWLHPILQKKWMDLVFIGLKAWLKERFMYYRQSNHRRRRKIL